MAYMRFISPGDSLQQRLVNRMKLLRDKKCQIVIQNYFQSIGMPRLSIFLSLTRQLIFLLPLLDGASCDVGTCDSSGGYSQLFGAKGGEQGRGGGGARVGAQCYGFSHGAVGKVGVKACGS